jgi:glycerophosphoryl diester phosphodiesterase
MRIPLPALASGAVLLLAALPLGHRPAAHRAAPRPAVVTIGHRGAPEHAPENTLASVDAAARLGDAWVENDVQTTRDGVPVVLHDATLTRTTDARTALPGRSPWRVGDQTLAEVERLDAGRWFGRRFAGQRVPTLDAYLRRLDRDGLCLLLEVKDPDLHPGLTARIAARLRADGWLDAAPRDRLVVQSFDAGAVREAHRLLPAVPTALLGAPDPRDLPADARWLDSVNADAAHVTRRYADAVHALRGAHGRPLRLLAWTVDDPAKAAALVAAGADGLISDRADVLRAALAGGAAPSGGR